VGETTLSDVGQPPKYKIDVGGEHENEDSGDGRLGGRNASRGARILKTEAYTQVCRGEEFRALR